MNSHYYNTAVRDERRRTANLFITEIRPRDAVTSRTPLTEDEERIEYKLAVLVYRCLHGSAPPYLASDFQRVADLGDRRRLRSSLTDALNMPSTRLSTVGDCAFPVAAARVWNCLPTTVTSSSSLLTFKRRIKTELFARSYPDC